MKRLTLLLVALSVVAMLMFPVAGFAKGRDARPLKGRFNQVTVNWAVDHFDEFNCDGTNDAGAKSSATGNVSHLGKTTSTVSAAWDWSTPAAGNYAPDGPTTSSSATVLGTYPHSFCSSGDIATGEVTLTAANGDQVFGKVAGGEIYELTYNFPGDGQESFVEVDITGGTGRFADATGSFVTHSILRFDPNTLSFEVIMSDLQGTIGY